MPDFVASEDYRCRHCGRAHKFMSLAVLCEVGCERGLGPPVPLTDGEAEAAYELAPTVELSPERIAEIVEYAIRGNS